MLLTGLEPLALEAHLHPMFIQTEPTPNPDVMKFLPGRDVAPAGAREFLNIDQATASPLAEALFELEGVDGVFFGPADLSASMGHLGAPGTEAVQRAVADGIAAVRRAGKAAGILSADPVLARRYLDMGALFVAVGVDTTLLSQAARNLARSFKDGAAAPVTSSGSVY